MSLQIEFNSRKYSSTKENSIAKRSRSAPSRKKKRRRMTKMPPRPRTITEELRPVCAVRGDSWYSQMNYRYIRRYREEYSESNQGPRQRSGELVQLFEVKGRRWYIKAEVSRGDCQPQQPATRRPVMSSRLLDLALCLFLPISTAIRSRRTRTRDETVHIRPLVVSRDFHRYRIESTRYSLTLHVTRAFVNFNVTRIYIRGWIKRRRLIRGRNWNSSSIVYLMNVWVWRRKEAWDVCSFWSF